MILCLYFVWLINTLSNVLSGNSFLTKMNALAMYPPVYLVFGSRGMIASPISAARTMGSEFFRLSF